MYLWLPIIDGNQTICIYLLFSKKDIPDCLGKGKQYNYDSLHTQYYKEFTWHIARDSAYLFIFSLFIRNTLGLF